MILFNVLSVCTFFSLIGASSPKNNKENNDLPKINNKRDTPESLIKKNNKSTFAPKPKNIFGSKGAHPAKNDTSYSEKSVIGTNIFGIAPDDASLAEYSNSNKTVHIDNRYNRPVIYESLESSANENGSVSSTLSSFEDEQDFFSSSDS